MLTIGKLREYGADVDTGLQRLMDNEEFYLKMVNVFLEEKNFNNLEEALKAGDLTQAFEAAHALKGVSANLSLTPFYNVIYELTELLRNGTQMDYSEYLDKIAQERQKLEDLVK